MNSITKLGALLLSAMLIAPAANAQKLPNQQAVLEVADKVNNYFMTKYADYKATSNVGRVRPSNIWTRGVYYEGLLALYSIYPQEKYYEYAYNWADFHEWSYRNGPSTRNADDYCAGQAYIDLYNLEPDPAKLRKVKANLDMLVNTPQVGDWTWIDAIQMGMPVFAKYGRLTSDSTYWEKMYKMYMASRNDVGGGLWCERESLWWRDADFVKPYKTPNGKHCFWSRGNGWVLAALARVLEEIPANEAHRTQYVEDFQAMCKALLKCQRDDGFWNVSLADEKDFGGKETTGTALFVYGFAWGINNGLLEAKDYLEPLTIAWNAMCADAVDPKTGFLGYVQGTGKEPKDGQPVTATSIPDFEDYGIGCFLLAATEVYKLAPEK